MPQTILLLRGTPEQGIVMTSPAILMIAITLAQGGYGTRSVPATEAQPSDAAQSAFAAEDRAGRFRPVLQRVAKMDFAQQQAFLHDLEHRADRAARLTLSPDEAAPSRRRRDRSCTRR